MAYTDNFVSELLPLVKDLESADKFNFSRLLFEKTYLPTDILNKHTLLTGVRNGNLVPIISDAPNYSSFPFVDANSCSRTECDIESNYSAKKWDLGLISCTIPICLRSFNDNFLIFWNSYKMLNPAKIDSVYLKTALLQYLTNKVKTNLDAAKWRVVYFADKNKNSNKFNGFNGFFTQMEANPDYVIKIDENDAATYTDQKQDGLSIYNTLVKMEAAYLQSTWAWDKPPVYRMTKTQATTLSAYLNSLKDTSCCDGIGKLNPDNIQRNFYKFDELSFHGIPIEVIPEWDNVINGNVELNGGGGDNPREKPNRIILTYKENLLIGTEEKDMLTDLDIFYDKKDRQVYITAESYLGSSVPLNHYILGI